MNQQEILNHLGIDMLNAMQQECISAWRSSHKLVLLAPTGSGKTLAYLLPLAEELGRRTEGRALVIVPSRELAQQTAAVLKQMSCGIQAVPCYGGRPAMDEHRLLSQVTPQVVVGTPGRLADHLRKGNIQGETIDIIIIDEFDKCLELGFREEMSEIITMLPNIRRRFLLSATDSDQIPTFAYAEGKDDNRGDDARGHERFVKLDFTDSQSDERLHLHLVHSPEKDKLQTLLQLLCRLGDTQSMVFVNYRESVERVASFLRKNRVEVSAFHGGMEQRDRERALYRFMNGSSNVMVSTDLAARGLDIANVNHIIHYHLPQNAEAQTHRNGRTARWNQEGDVWLILGPNESHEDAGKWKEEHLQLAEMSPEQMAVPRPKWTTIYIGKGKKDKVNRVDVVGFLIKSGGLQRDEIGRVDVGDHFAYAAVTRERVREVLHRVRGLKIKGLHTIFEEAR